MQLAHPAHHGREVRSGKCWRRSSSSFCIIRQTSGTCDSARREQEQAEVRPTRDQSRVSRPAFATNESPAKILLRNRRMVPSTRWLNRGSSGARATDMSGKRRRKSKPPARRRPLVELCPGLTDDNHKISSPATFRYNCIAWAAGVATKKWGDQKPYFSPKEVSRGADVQSLIGLFEWLGYKPCDGGCLEPGIERVALYALDGNWTHAARQRSDGTWTSKLGDFEDIDHRTPEAVAGADYGEIAAFMKRAW